MKKYISIFFLSFLVGGTLLSCKSSNLPAVTSTEKKTIINTIVIHDTIFKTEPDLSSYKALLECQNGKVVIRKVLDSKSGKTSLKKPKARIEDNTLYVDCETKARELFAQWKSESKQEVTEIERKVPQYIEKPMSFWLKIQIWCGRIFLLIISFTIAFQLLKIKNKI